MQERPKPIDSIDQGGGAQVAVPNGLEERGRAGTPPPGPDMRMFRHLLRLKRQFTAINGYEPEGYVCVPSRVNILG